MLELKFAVSKRNLECKYAKIRINDQPSKDVDLRQLEKDLRDGKIKVTAHAKNGTIYYNTIG